MKDPFLIQNNVSLAPLSTFQIGGKAKYFVRVKSPEELIEAVKYARERKMAYKVFAGGSNVIFPDEGLDCLMIQVKGGKCAVNMREITSDGGVLLRDIINEAIVNGLSGLEYLSGIPGTIGGAVVGNAGAYGHSISEVVEKVEIFENGLADSSHEIFFEEARGSGKAFFGDVRRPNSDSKSLHPYSLNEALPPKDKVGSKASQRQGFRTPQNTYLSPLNSNSNSTKGIIRWISREECEFGYRESIFKRKPYLILRVWCKFKNGDPKKLKKISQDIIKIREKKYKPGLKCPGSFFKNVLAKEIDGKSLDLVDRSKIIDGKIPAGYLLSEVEARGMKIGGIEIADFHGNLFINRGDGKASDVKKLAKILKERVRDKFGIKLEEEIRYF